MNKNWMIYGANGYTGELIAREAKKRGYAPVLAGRSQDKIKPLAEELGLPFRAFGLDQPRTVAAELESMDAVLHCAGPYSATSAPMVQGCLTSKTHYLDITGELQVFSDCRDRDAEARETGIIICPGVGFDVIPTDCLAAALKEALPDATHLILGFESTAMQLSPGTTKTMIESIGHKGTMRRTDGKLEALPAPSLRTLDFGRGNKQSMSISWGDVATAFYSTGIPNIEVFIPTDEKQLKLIKLMGRLKPILRLGPVQSLLKAGVTKKVKGPDQTDRDKASTYLFGEVRNLKGEIKTGRFKTASGYKFTYLGALYTLEHILKTSTPGGYYTPSRLLGTTGVENITGTTKISIS